MSQGEEKKKINEAVLTMPTGIPVFLSSAKIHAVKYTTVFRLQISIWMLLYKYTLNSES